VANDRLIIAPSILSADFARLGDQVQAADDAGADWFHIDVMDGRFVPNITMGPLVVSAIRRVTSKPLDVHLMIVEPERYIQAFADAGADHIAVHLEVSPNLHRTLQLIQTADCKAGVAINPHSPAVLLKEVIHILDIVNVMTVNPGFGGQEFLKEMMAKVTEIQNMAHAAGRQIDIEVDGGIDAVTARVAKDAGANVLIAGTSIFGSKEGISAGIKALRESATRL